MKIGFSALCAASFVLLAACVPYLPGGDSADEANKIWKALQDRYTFRRLAPRPGHGEENDDGRQVYVRPLAPRTELYIYGIHSRTDQDRIIAILDDIRRTKRTHSIAVTFYANDRANDGPEQPIRRVLIRDPKPREYDPHQFHM